MQEQQAQVVIVGGGPVGMGLAIELGQRGVRVVVVERYPTPQPVPKGQNLTQRTMEHFHFWGAEKELRAARTVPKEYGIGGLTAYGTLLGDYHYDWLQRELVRPYYFTDNERLPQYATEAVLRARAAQLGCVEILYGWTGESLEQDRDGVTVTAVRREDGERIRIRGDYAVGSDGSRSIMREAAGITQTRSDHDRLMVLLVFRSTGLHELLKRFPGKSFYNVLHPDLKGYWQFFGRVDLGNSWFFHAPCRRERRRTISTSSPISTGRSAPSSTSNSSISASGISGSPSLTTTATAASSSPVTPPTAIRPMAATVSTPGLRMRANLGWKLAATLDGWGGSNLLDSYDAERRPVFASTARDFIGKAIESDRAFLSAHDPLRDRAGFEAEWSARSSGARGEVDAFEPNYRGSQIVAGEPGAITNAVGSHRFEARAGHHLAPQSLSDGRDVYEALGEGFTLLAFDADEEAVGQIRAAAERAGLPLAVVSDTADGGRKKYRARLVLVRPDQFVAWTSDDAPPDPAALLALVSGRP
jgi:2-polyprenyl-6-methoxyphenol hydroxylase-like FAD-dependent oxidoreductase